MTTQVWFHSNCLDGFGAAYAAWRKFGDKAVYIAVQYGYPPPKVELDDTVYILDFSYDYETLMKLAEMDIKIVLLDHHKSAFDNLAGKEFPLKKFKISLDMDRSGTVMAWEFFHPSTVIPSLILHIQDRDLWQWKIPGTKEICAALDSYPKQFEIWHRLMDNQVQRLYQEGVAITRYRQQQVDILVNAWKRSPWFIWLDGQKGPLINAPYFLVSELLHELAEGYPFAANIIYTVDKQLFSLRSQPDGADVAAIAKKYGGGGHVRASGFSLTPEDYKRVLTDERQPESAGTDSQDQHEDSVATEKNS